ncbi:hypothetical protein AAFG13_04760 [Bradyrhizobium sp. B124]|uniref:hypothetical protein n=1 Tax=Bradyrhizobium sp. B124 TaxID=3140245 RepID=UPI0031840392
MADVRGKSGNDMARVSAANALEQLAEPNGLGGIGGGRARAGWMIDLSDEPQRPGLVIVMNPALPRQQSAGEMIDVTPNDE